MSRVAEKHLGDSPYAGEPGWKEPTTSKDAARAVDSRATILRHQVYTAILAAGERGLTADEVAAKLGISVLSARPRVSELAKAAQPWIVPTGERRKNESGLFAKVWKAAR
jgi:DNA-directed RNA polymerase specialized sigma24 family protein